MDILFGSEADKTNDYYLVMGGLEARMLKESALTASQFINDNRLRIDFVNNITVFIECKMEILSGAYPETSKKEAMTHLKEERGYLIHQENLIRQKRVTQNMTIEIKQENNLWSYVVKGAFILGGAGQFLAGAGMVIAGVGACATLVGCVVGVASMTAGLVLAIHGINSIAENSVSLYRNDPNYKWYVSEWYEKGAVALGYTKAHGDLVYAGVDIALSGYGLLKNVLKPDAWRLFHYLNNDFLRGYQTMTRPQLILEIGVDGLTTMSAYSATGSMQR